MSNTMPNNQRRNLLRALGAAGLSLPLLRHAQAAAPADAWVSAYAKYDGPFSANFDGKLEAANLQIDGKLPAALRGTLYRNGPARIRLGATNYQHWFDGDGMVQAFRLGDGKASHRGVLLRTPKLVEEEAAGRFLYPAFGTNFAGSQAVRNPDAINVANINLLAMNQGRDLYALWEGGSALRIDPHTLDAQGFKVWSPDTAGAPFSAHPRIAPDGTVWNFGYMPGSGKLLVYEIAADGGLKRQAILEAEQADMVHDFAITERYLVFLLMPMKFERSEQAGASFLDQYHWQNDAPLVAMLVDKQDFSIRRFTLPNGGVFHLGNAWEEKGVVRFSYAIQRDFLPAMRHMQIARQHKSEKIWPTVWSEVELDLGTGRARQDVSLSQVEFARFDIRHTGRPTKLTVLMQRSAKMSAEVSGFDSVLALRMDKGQQQLQRHVYGAGWIAEEHIFVPLSPSAKEGEGWILGTAYNWVKERTTLSVFDAQHLGDGPLAQVHLPYGLPLGLHGQFVTG